MLKRIMFWKLTIQSKEFWLKNAMQMADLEDNSVHLLVTSPPYFNAKMYSKETKDGDLGNVHDLEEWFEKNWTSLERST